MKKVCFVVVLLISCILGMSNIIEASEVPIENEVIATLLTPHIINAIHEQYGEYRQFDLFNTKILNIRKAPNGEFDFAVSVYVETFVGPHNPPYGYDTLLFEVTPSFVKLERYEHRD